MVERFFAGASTLHCNGRVVAPVSRYYEERLQEVKKARVALLCSLLVHYCLVLEQKPADASRHSL